MTRTRRYVVAGLAVSAALAISGLGAAGAPPAHSSPSPSSVAVAQLGPISPVWPRSQGEVPNAETLAHRLDAVPKEKTGTTSVMVVDGPTGQTLFGAGQDRAMIPASNMKLLTCVAALSWVSSDYTVETSVLRAGPDAMVLQGGGDPLLATHRRAAGYPRPASLETLADRTAEALLASGTTSITLAFDDSLFVGPAWHPAWPEGYQTEVAPISALAADQGRPGGVAQPDPGAQAAAEFAHLLGQRGVTVRGKLARRPAPGEATTVASVTSLPFEEWVEYALVHSDNVVTEVLARHAAMKAGLPASFPGSTLALARGLEKLLLPTKGMTASDTSGLSRDNRVSARLLALTVERVVRDDAFAAVRAGLPVAGATGTLSRRMTDPAAAPALGWVRAKTGNLSGVSSLSGYTQTASGRDVVFAMLANGGEYAHMRTWLDRAAAALTACGC